MHSLRIQASMHMTFRLIKLFKSKGPVTLKIKDSFHLILTLLKIETGHISVITDQEKLSKLNE